MEGETIWACRPLIYYEAKHHRIRDTVQGLAWFSRPRKTLRFEAPAERFNACVASTVEPGPQRTFVHRRQVGLGREQDQAVRSGLSVRVGAAEAIK